MSERFIGIDLGTTNSCVATVEDGVPKVIANRGGYKTTPSMIAIAENGRRLVGHLAKRQAITNATNTVYAAKRVIGRPFASSPVQQAKGSLPYKLVEGDGGDVRVELRGQRHAVAELSALVLQEMKKIAEDYFGEPVDKAVITIPAYFNDGQRQATKDAGRIAGLDVIRIINEPTAAALAYGFKKHIHKKVAVYDLGGGTFDVSILEIRDGVFEVLATAGDTYLGGEDFDQRIVEWLVFGFAKEHKLDLRSDSMALQRLRDAAENAKIQLSLTASADINLPFLISTGKSDAIHLQRTLTREKYEELVGDLVEKTVEICDRLMRDAKVNKRDLHEVILVGGMTRMPRVQEAVKQFFGLEPARSVHPDEVVALGAAVQAAALLAPESGADGAGGELLLLDVTPLNLGVMIAGGFVQTLIPANTTVPTSASHTFTTARDDQASVKIVVLQGSSRVAAQNELLGEFVLEGLPAGPRGSVEVEVTFDISSDGLVSVAAMNKSTGLAQRIDVTASNKLPEREVEQIAASHQELAVVEKNLEEFQAARTDVERSMREIEKLTPTVVPLLQGSDFGADAIKKMQLVVERAQRGIAMQDVETLRAVKEPLERTATMLKGIATRAGASS